ncbi:MAG TPA: PRC-barrel domain-containing protein, partial [Propionibacteriaceae bacterium]|nr:PRC-barrel domain-containing protein [Propionibacteriaceae bacterium]
MITISTDQLSSIAQGHGDVVTSGGEKIGSIGQIYVDDTTGDPTWVTAKTGLFGTSESFVPLQGANISGSNVQVNYDKATVKDAPRVDADGALSPEEEETLYSYYGLSGGNTAGRDYDNDNVTTDRDHDDTTSGFVGGGVDRDRDNDGDKDGGLIDRAKDKLGGRDNDRDNDNDRDFSSDRDTVGHDTSGPTTDDAMTLSEERVNVGVQRREAGRARLRK